MAKDLVKRVSNFEKFFHWVHMLSFAVLALTGLGLYAQSFFGVTNLFGGVHLSRTIHHYMGVIFIVTTFVIFFQWFKDITAQGEDSFRDVVKSYLDQNYYARSGKFNAGQKVFAWIVFLTGLIMGGTGLAMWFPFMLGRGLQQWMYFLHNFFYIFLMIWMIAHVYLSTMGNPGTWQTMTRGTVTRVWAKKHHPAWEPEDA
jgi:formate dehydrogenase subunit gamma